MKRSRRWTPSASRITSSWRRSFKASASQAGRWPVWGRAGRPCMCQLAGDEVLGDGRQLVLVGAVVERVAVLAGFGQDLVRMHPRPCRAEDRFGHEGGQQSAALGNRLDRVLEGDQLVRALHGVAEREVQLVLPGRDLM